MTAQQIGNAQTADDTPRSATLPVDLRLTLPFPRRPVFIALVAGHERRSPARRADERRQHPLHTVGNVLFMLTSLAGFYALAMLTMLAANSIVSF